MVIKGRPCKRPSWLDFDGFSDGQSIFKFDTKIPDSAIHFGVPQQKLDSAQVARLFVDLCHLGPAH